MWSNYLEQNVQRVVERSSVLSSCRNPWAAWRTYGASLWGFHDVRDGEDPHRSGSSLCYVHSISQWFYDHSFLSRIRFNLYFWQKSQGVKDCDCHCADWLICHNYWLFNESYFRKQLKYCLIMHLCAATVLHWAMKSRERQHQPQMELQPLKEPTNQTQVSEHTADKDAISPKPKDFLTYSVTPVNVCVWAQTPIYQHQQPRKTMCNLGLGMFSASGLYLMWFLFIWFLWSSHGFL